MKEIFAPDMKSTLQKSLLLSIVFRILKFFQSKEHKFIRKDAPKVTMTVFVIKAVAMILQAAPDINGRIAFGKVFFIYK